MKPEDLDFLAALVRARSGIVLTGERGFFAETRLGPLARRERLASVSDLVARLREQPGDEVARAVVEAMTLQDTSFFRDRAVFTALATQILPALMVEAGARPLRLWSAGCASGQEAYSLAMLAADGDVAPIKADILASDISTTALDKARAGLYTHFEVQRGLPIRRLLDHFEEAEDAWRASAALRAAVRWKRINLVDPLSGGEPFDLILCRNVVSAFAPEARAQALATLTASLTPTGRLVLGAAEPAPDGFEADAGAPGIYRRTGAVAAHFAAA